MKLDEALTKLLVAKGNKMKASKECKSCSHYWTKGIKDGGHNMWCCKYGKPAPHAIGECKLKSGYNSKKEIK